MMYSSTYTNVMLLERQALVQIDADRLACLCVGPEASTGLNAATISSNLSKRKETQFLFLRAHFKNLYVHINSLVIQYASTSCSLRLISTRNGQFCSNRFT